MKKNRKYIKISSEGEIDINSFLIMGGSTKREQENKIGRFGSGLKYSIAVLAKLENNFKVYSGLGEIQFEVEPVSFRDENFNMLTINGHKTNFSTEMGPDWDYYDVIRDIYSNAVDEGLIDFCGAESLEPKQGETHFYIEVTPDMSEFIENIDKYFLRFRNDKPLLYSDKRKISVYRNRRKHLMIYKQGFLIHDDENTPSLFCYDLDGVDITESRKLKHYYAVKYDIAQVLFKEANEDICRIYKNSAKEVEDDGSTKVFEIAELDFDYFTEMSPAWQKAFEGDDIVTKESASFYNSNSYMASSGSRSSIIPHSLASNISGASIRGVIDKNNNPHDFAELGFDSGDYSKVAEMKRINIAFDYNFEVKKVRFRLSGVNVSFASEGGETFVLLSEDIWEDEQFLISRYFEMAIHLSSKSKNKLRSVDYYENVINHLVKKIT